MELRSTKWKIKLLISRARKGWNVTLINGNTFYQTKTRCQGFYTQLFLFICLKTVFFGELRNIIRFSISNFEARGWRGLHNLYENILFIKCVFTFVSWFRLCREKQGTSLRRNRKNKQWSKLVYNEDRRRKPFMKIKLNGEIVENLSSYDVLSREICVACLVIATWLLTKVSSELSLISNFAQQWQSFLNK